MKFKEPYSKPLPESGERLARSHGRSEWLKEWLANQGRYVELNCGHKEDLNDRTLLVIGVLKAELLCEQCNAWTTVKKPVTFAQYKGISPSRKTPIDPLF